MAEFTIGSYFEDDSGPVTGLIPKIRIWEILSSGRDLVIGQPCGSGNNSDGIMQEVEDCMAPNTQKDGFYSFNFTDTEGYDATKTYVVRVDGGPTLATAYRYQVERITPADALSVESISDQVWDEPKVDHLNVGSTGEALSQIKSDTTAISQNLYLGSDSVLGLVELLVKLSAGRTKIDPSTNTLTVYDEDCTTVLRVYKLYDSAGAESVTDVCERKPVTKGPSDTSSITDVCP